MCSYIWYYDIRKRGIAVKKKHTYAIMILIVLGLLSGKISGGDTSVRGNGLLSLFPEKVQELFNK